MKKTLLLFTSLLSLVMYGSKSYGQVSGTKVIGTDYATLAAAINALNTSGISGNVVINVPAGYTETAPTGGYLLGSAALNASVTSSSTLTIQKSGTGADPLLTAPVGTSTTVDGIFIIQGTDYVTINGIDLTESSANTTATTQMEWGYALVKRQNTAPFDGCQNVTIKNSAITLNLSNTASVGIYSGTHIATNNTALTITTTTDALNNCTFTGNTIANVNTGISLNGYSGAASPYNLYDQNNTIGGATSNLGNTITNFGGTTTTAYGINLVAQNGDIAGYNIITSSTTPGASESVKGIYLGVGYNSTFTANANTFQLTGGSGSGSLYGIQNGTGSAGSGLNGTGSLYITNNIFQNYTFTASNSGTHYFGLYNYGGSSGGWTMTSVVMSNNTVQNCNNLNATGTIYLFYNYYCSSNDVRFNNNKINSMFRSGTSGNTYCYYNYYGSPTGGTDSTVGNKISNVSSPYSLYGFYQYMGVTTRNRIIMYDTLTNDTASKGSTYYYLYGLYTSYGNNVTVQNNYLNNLYSTPSNYGYIYGIYTSYPNSITVSNNTLTNLSDYFSYMLYSYYPVNSLQVNNNTVSNVTVSSGGGYLCYNYSQGTANVYNNVIKNVTGTGAAYFYCIYNIGGTTENFYNDTVYNISTVGGSYIYGMYNSGGTTVNIYNNQFGKIVNTGTSGNVYGLYASSGTTVNFYNNLIDTLTTSGTSGLGYGIYESGPSTFNCYKNKLSYISATGSGSSVNGMYLNSGVVTAYNNIVGDLRTPAYSGSGTVGGQLVGIYCGGGSSYNLYYNTVNINGTSTGANFGSCAVYASTTPTLVNFRNNVFINTSTANGTGIVAAYRRSATTLTNYTSSSSNNNLFYAGTPGTSNLIMYDGTNSYQTLAAYKTAVNPVDASSVTENTTFQSIGGVGATFLAPSTTVATQIESDGVNISGITDDFYGTTRAGNTGYAGTGTSPDLGAVEGNYVANDLSAPAISYTPLPFTCITGDRMFTATISDYTGVPTTGALVPRVYFKKNSGSTWYSTPGTLTSGNSKTGIWSFTISASTLGGLSIGDVVNYFILAQDSVATPNVGSSPSGAVATNVNTVTTYPTTPNSYSVSTTLSGTYTVGTTGTYTTISAAISAYNNSCISGPVTFSLTDATYPSESFPITILANAYASATNTLTIKPATGVAVTVTGTSSATSIFRLLAANYITIDGVNAGGSSLTLSGAYTGSFTDIWLASTTASGNSNITLKNMTLYGGSNGTTSDWAILASASATSPSTGGGMDNDNVTITGNTFLRCGYGIYTNGSAAVSAGGLDNWTISNNTFGPATYDATNNISYNAMFLQNMLTTTISGNTMRNIGLTTIYSQVVGIYLSSNMNGVTITQNNISNVSSQCYNTGTGSICGIYLGTGVINATVTRNVVDSLIDTYAYGYGPRGIMVNTGVTSSNVVIANNFIYGMLGYSYSTPNEWPEGIAIEGTSGGVGIYFNTINLSDAYPGYASYYTGTACIYVNTSNMVDIRDNILVNTFNNTNATSYAYKGYAIYSSSANSVYSYIDYNDYYVGGLNVLGYLGSDLTTMSALQTGFGGNTHSLNLAPTFISSTNLHLLVVGTNSALVAGLPTSGITTDIDGTSRSATTPVIGAHEVHIPNCSNVNPGTIAQSAPICVSGVATLSLSGATSAAGLTYQWKSSTDSVTFTNISGATSYTYSMPSAITTSTFYRAVVTCTITGNYDSTAKKIKVNPLPAIAVTPATVTLCSGTSTSLAATGGVTYSWSPTTSLSSATTAVVVASPTVSATYSVTGTDANGCANTAAVPITVNAAPGAVTLSPATATACSGSSVTYTASSSVSSTALSQDFNSGLGGWTIVNTGATSTWNWAIRAPGGLASNTSITGDGSNFVGADPDQTGSGINLNTTLYTPVFSTVGYTSASLKCNYYCYSSSTYDAAAEVDYSIDGGTTWTLLYTYYNTISGTTTWSASTPTQTITLPAAALNQANLKLRWYYNSTWGFYWALDNVVVSGTVVPSITWSPSTGLYSDAGLTTSYTGGSATTVYAAPTAASTTTIGYTASASNSGCITSNTATLTVNALPAQYTITGGGSYCSGTGGTAIGLSGSVTGVNYQLYRAGTAVGSTVPGTGSAITFGMQSVAGVYTVVATNTATSCSRTMTGSATVSINPLPTAYPITGGGGYCAGGSGTHVGLLYANSGVNYQLYLGSSTTGSAIAGTNAALDFGLKTAAGTYSVSATDATTGCTNNMTGTTTVSVNPLPAANNMTGGGSYCSGGTGVAIGLDGSSSGINYRLYNGAAPSGASVAGTGGAISFGLKTVAGTYTVLATDATTSCTAAMTGSKNVVINPLPVIDTITGGGSYCSGGTGVNIGLNSSQTGVSYQLYNGSVASGTTVVGTGSALNFGLHTAAGTYSVVATNTITNCTSNMWGTVTITINPLPTAYTVTGGGSYCDGGTGATVGLSGSAVGISYQLYNGSSAVGSALPGTSLTLSFGPQTAEGTYSVVATNTATGCVSNMSGSTPVSINPLPVAYTVSGGGSYCAGGAGVDVQQDVTDPGINYQLYNGATPVGSAVAGTGLGIDYGMQTIAGTYSVVATDAVTGCTSNMMGTAPVMVNAMPVAYNITGGGSYCSGGAGVDIALDGSEAGVTYQLNNGTTATGSAITGTGSSIDFGSQTVEGSYNVVATNGSGCSSNMSGSAVININPLPAAYYVTGGGNYCASGAGVHVGLSASNSGINYQLYNGSTATGTAIGGSGLDVDFGLQTAAGTYTVQATDAATGCTNNMMGATVISINALPTAYNVTGGGSYCAGGAGKHVGLDNSATGINYQLYYGSAVSGSAVAGTGSALDFGLLTGGGTYTVLATDASTGCTYGMTGSAPITVNSLPAAFTIAGGGSYCAGGAGVDVSLPGSESGISYQLYNGSSAVGSAATGTGSAIDFGNQTAAGTYSVIATNSGTGCTSNMTGTATVSINTQPIVYGVTGTGSYCIGGTGVHVGLTGSDASVTYQLYDGSSVVGSVVTGTGTALDFGLQTATGTYTVLANPGTTCSTPMSGSAIVSTTPLPAVYTVTGGGSYCSGSTGVHVGLNSSATGVNYQLYDGSTAVGAAVSGTTGTALDFGLQTAAGTYTVLATNATTTCQNTMTGSAAVTISPLVAPSVVVTPAASTTVCAGSLTSFSAAPTNGGTAPVYQWSVNGIATGSSSASYSYVPANGDIVKAVLTSNATCASPDTASSAVTMTVVNNVLPVASITATSENVCQGTVVTYTASVLYDGTTPSYTWVRNGAVAGTGLSYTDIPVDGDIVYFVLNSSLECVTMSTVYSNNVLMTVDTPYVPAVSITANPGTTIFPGMSDTLNASVVHGGLTPSYQWKLNGSNIAGATNSSYVSSTFANNDSVTCFVTSSGACGLGSFNSIIIRLKNVGVTQVSEANSDIRLLPNPNKGSFDIRGTLGTINDEEVSMEITDMLGQVVYKNKVLVKGGNLSEHIELSNNLANGMYMLNLHSEDNDHKVFHFVLEQ